jgi:hypothetical protein
MEFSLRGDKRVLVKKRRQFAERPTQLFRFTVTTRVEVDTFRQAAE